MNWAQRIQAARKRRRFTIKDKALACKWNSCSVGEKLHLQSMTTEEAFEEVDDHHKDLLQLGMDFTEAVRASHALKAQTVHQAIQKSPLQEQGGR